MTIAEPVGLLVLVMTLSGASPEPVVKPNGFYPIEQCRHMAEEFNLPANADMRKSFDTDGKVILSQTWQCVSIFPGEVEDFMRHAQAAGGRSQPE